MAQNLGVKYSNFIFLTMLLVNAVSPVKAHKSHDTCQRSKRDTHRKNAEPDIAAQCKKSLSYLQKMKIELVEEGVRNQNHKIFFRSAKGLISPLHDIPLYTNYDDKIFNMVVENPGHTTDKMEILLHEALNPISDGGNKGGYVWNYGALPQTWENPDERDAHGGHKGDGHPVDVLDIGTELAARGDIIPVKVLGAIGLITEGVIDWKIIAIFMGDSMAGSLNDIADVNEKYPSGTLKFAVDFFRLWNAGKNVTLFGEPKNRAFAHKIIEDSNRKWVRLMQGKVKDHGVSLLNTCVEGSKDKISFEEAQAELDKRWSLEHFFGVGNYSTARPST